MPKEEFGEPSLKNVRSETAWKIVAGGSAVFVLVLLIVLIVVGRLHAKHGEDAEVTKELEKARGEIAKMRGMKECNQEQRQTLDRTDKPAVGTTNPKIERTDDPAVNPTKQGNTSAEAEGQAQSHKRNESCPQRFGHRLRNSCYFLGLDKKSWRAANHSCDNHKSHLLDIETEEEQKHIESFLWEKAIKSRDSTRDPDDVFLLTDGQLEKLESRFVWRHPRSQFNYTNWATGQPGNKIKENCLTLSKKAHWKWTLNDYEMAIDGYICEINLRED